MDDTFFVDSSAFAALIEFVGSYVVLGVGLALCFWGIGFCFAFVRDFLRGGV